MGIGRIARAGRVGRVGILAGTAPQLVSAIVQAGGLSLVLTFDRAIDAADLFAGTLFVHASGGDLNGAIGGLGPSDSVSNSTTITLNGNSRQISAGETLTIDYHDIPTTRITDHATGRRLGNFAGRSVTNNA